MMREILDSILRQAPELTVCAVSTYKELVSTQRSRRPTWDLESLTACLSAIFQQRNVVIKLMMFLDALDEHEGNNKSLVQILRSFAADADGRFVTLKICVASRPWSVFADSFGKGPSLALHEHTKDDILAILNPRLNPSLLRL